MNFQLLIIVVSLFTFRAFGQDVNTLQTELSKAKHDTTRANVLSQLVLVLTDDSKWKYNDTLRQYVEQKLKVTSVKSVNYKVYRKYLAFVYNQEGLKQMNFEGDFKGAIPKFEKALKIRQELNDKTGSSAILSNLGYAYFGAQILPKSFKSFNKALEIRKEIGDSSLIALSYYQVAVYYSRQHEIPNGLKYHFKALKIRERLNDAEGLAHSYNDIGTLFYFQKDLDQALKFYTKSLKYENKFDDQAVIAGVYGNIALVYNLKGDKEKTLEYLMKALNFSREKNYQKIISSSANNIGQFYQQEGELNKALIYYNMSLEIDKALNNSVDLSISYVNLSNVYFELKKYPMALEFARKSLDLAEKSNYPKSKEDAQWMFYVIYKALGKHQEALDHFELFVAQRDENNSKENQQAISDMKYRYEYEKKAAADSIQSAGEKMILDEKLKQEKTERYTLYGGIGLTALFALFMFNRFRVTQRQKGVIEAQEKETKKQNELIFSQKIEVEHQKAMVEEKQREIIDSIAYAKRLQDAILPPLDLIDSNFPENFVLYKPKDIVAGDFYWAEQLDDMFFVAAADSTGHGVPGAMVSVVCSNALNRSVKEFGLRLPGEILNKTRELVVETFAKNNAEVKDGMDISLLCLDKKNKQVSWSGANNPLWYIENKEWKEIKADKQPIGKSDHNKSFTTHTIEITEPTLFYLFTDGFADQFGGEKGKKFKYTNFKELLFQVSTMELQKQREFIEIAFEQWKGELEQVDDVCLMALKVTL